jgi:hypothetical protein
MLFGTPVVQCNAVTADTRRTSGSTVKSKKTRR